jgi:SAM-dependent methyltransferase
MARLFGPSARPFSDPLAPSRGESTSRDEAVGRVRQYWELASCGTDAGRAEQGSRAWYDEIERARYSIEPFIPSFANFAGYAGRTVLEIGVGAGTDFVQWCRAGAVAHGVDLTAEAIENTSRRLALEALTAASLRQADAANLPFPSDSFDCVYSWGVLHHAIDTEMCVREAFRVLRPSGTLKLMLYNRQSLYARYLWLRHGLPRGKSQAWAVAHFLESEGTSAYTPNDVARMLTGLPAVDQRAFYWDQIVRPGAKLRTFRQLASTAFPITRWFMGIEVRKGVAD